MVKIVQPVDVDVESGDGLGFDVEEGFGVAGGVGAISLAQATGMDSKNRTNSPIIVFLIISCLL